MTRRNFFLGLLLAITTASINAAAKPDTKPATPAASGTNAPNEQVIAYYFHGTIRCETCLKIEKQAKEMIERRFKAEVDTKRLVFKPVNYEQPENTHFLQDYKLPCPSLVLVRQQDGRDRKWKLLGNTWEFIEDRAKFDSYVENATREFLGQDQSSGNPQSDWPPAADRR